MTVIFRISHAPEPALRARSIHGCPMVISDSMAPVQSMLDGKMYDSKAALRSTYRAAGVTEVGNDPSILRKGPKPKPDRQAVKAAVGRAFSKAGLGA
jgi:hypothetical protein